MADNKGTCPICEEYVYDFQLRVKRGREYIHLKCKATVEGTCAICLAPMYDFQPLVKHGRKCYHEDCKKTVKKTAKEVIKLCSPILKGKVESEIKGPCALCNKQVTSNDERVRFKNGTSVGSYCHQICYNRKIR